MPGRNLLHGVIAVLHEHSWLTLVAFLALVPILTFVATSIISLLGRYSSRDGREPPLKPYWIPYLGDFLGYSMARKKLVEATYHRYGGSMPLTLKLGPAKAYLLLQPESFPPLLRDSRACTNKVFSVLMMEYVFGSPKRAMHVYKNDNSGVGATPLPGTNVPPHLRIWFHQHKSNGRYLTGENLKQLSARMLDCLSAELAKTDSGNPVDSGDWATVPHFFDWWVHKLTAAHITASFGPHLLRLNPGFVEDFWTYLGEWPYIASFYPRWLAPRGYEARDRVLEGIKRWYAFAREHSDYRATGPNDPAWDDYWGMTWHKVRHQWGQNTGEWDDDGLAAEDLALVVASNANVLPMCFWNLMHVFSDRELLARVQDEYRACIVPPSTDSGGGEPKLPLRFDITNIVSSPLSQSIYAEALRIHVVMFHNRSPNLHDYRLGQFTLRKGGVVTLPSMIASHHAGLWGDVRTAGGKRPLDAFWADRFLVPDEKEDKVAADAGERKMKFSTEGLEGAWIPYGGGSFICPGRHLAKRLIIGTAAVFAAYFDMEPVHGVPPMDDRFFGLGTMPPAGHVPVRIRRRLGVVQPLRRQGSRSRPKNAWFSDGQG
ncbi:cytochrome P450 [Achaetomium macrosporum]|uniref:Cytochrome P450 n=1 Tax=Achaetomium macrosporum TaxID=79813 RepID=A0AAN7CB40_9PEZI|nr:cytochrome P450 [Achaetomium macrosporum]